MDSSSLINSKEYWNKRFATGDWEEKGGNHQTHYFYELLYTLLPKHLKEEFNDSEKQYSIADIGCAEGDGSKFLAEKFFNAKVSGIDIAEAAVEKANALYPEIDFSTKLNQQYDIIVSSNVLEHFKDPREHMKELFHHSDNYVIILVPFEEQERIEEHFYTFLYKDFQLQFEDFNLVHIHGVKADTNIWNGKQHLFVYQKNAELSQVSLETFGLEKMMKNAETELSTVMQELQSTQQELQSTQQELQTIQQKLQTIEQELYTIKRSKIWRLATKYYKMKNKFLSKKYLYTDFKSNLSKIIKIYQRNGIKGVLRKLKPYFKRNTKPISLEWIDILPNYDKIIIIPSAFEFDELYNQRPINMSKYFSEENYLVLYVVWEWRRSEIEKRGLVYKNLYQIPMYEFLDYCNQMRTNHFHNAIYLINIPSKQLVDISYFFRKKGFAITYDIMDEWEEFYKSGDASWYRKEYEEHAVLISDVVTTVSQSLVEKFNFIREDLAIIGNGYTPNVLGVKNKYIALKHKTDSQIIGYFGHLTESWFDWELIINTASKYPNLHFEIIGYGEPLWVQKKVKELKNINLVGKVHTSELYKYVQHWNIAMIPFKTGELSKAVDPIKIYEYIYFGLPTIATGIEHLDTFPNTFVAKNNDDFEKIIFNILETPLIENKTLNTFLDQTTWHARFQYFEELILNNNSYQRLFK